VNVLSHERQMVHTVLVAAGGRIDGRDQLDRDGAGLLEEQAADLVPGVDDGSRRSAIAEQCLKGIGGLLQVADLYAYVVKAKIRQRTTLAQTRGDLGFSSAEPVSGAGPSAAEADPKAVRSALTRASLGPAEVALSAAGWGP